VKNRRNNLSKIFQRAAVRKRRAEEILHDLQLIELWSLYGRPVVVGAMAYDLMVAPDIDLEIYCLKPDVQHGFKVLAKCALDEHVIRTRFANHLNKDDQAFFWQIEYKDDEDCIWEIDMWSAAETYALPRGEALIAPLKSALTPELRKIILGLKEELYMSELRPCTSIYLYQAVLEGGVRTVDELVNWLASNKTAKITSWKPIRRRS
jgi:hypothetical protein